MAGLKSALERAVGRFVVGLPDGVVARLAGTPISRDGRTLDAQVQLGLVSQKAAGLKPAHVLGHDAARRDMEKNGNLFAPDPLPAIASVVDTSVAGVPARIYRPLGGPGTQALPALLYFHGGGHTVGSLNSHAGVCQVLCAGLGAVVVAVDYRLAPEHRFPAAIDDCSAAFRATVADAAALGIDPARVAVGGDSAGGNLAAVVCLDPRHDVVRPRAQLLIYPVVDMTMSFPSIESLGHGFYLERDTVAWFCANYLGDVDPKHPRASPWFAADLAGLPPAVVVTAGFDPLRDEGNAFATRLAQAGVAVDHREYPSLFHGFFNTSGVIRAASVAVQETISLLRARLQP